MLKVLIVEDDADDSETIRKLVRDVGLKFDQPFFTEHAHDIATAHRLMRLQQYDLFIVDFYLAGGTGLELVRELRLAGRTPPVILVSGRDTIEMPVELMEWLARGELTFMPKADLTPDAFAEVLRGILSREVDVLLIEDDQDEFKLTRSYLQLNPFYRFNVRWASNLDEARLRMRQESFDVILVDYMLGEESGAAFITELIEAQVQVPIVLFSGQDLVQANEQMVRLIGRRKLGFLSKAQMSTESLSRTLIHTLN